MGAGNDLRRIGHELFAGCRAGEFGSPLSEQRFRMFVYATRLFEMADQMDRMGEQLRPASPRERQMSRRRPWWRRLLPWLRRAPVAA